MVFIFVILENMNENQNNCDCNVNIKQEVDHCFDEIDPINLNINQFYMIIKYNGKNLFVCNYTNLCNYYSEDKENIIFHLKQHFKQS